MFLAALQMSAAAMCCSRHTAVLARPCGPPPLGPVPASSDPPAGVVARVCGKGALPPNPTGHCADPGPRAATGLPDPIPEGGLVKGGGSFCNLEAGRRQGKLEAERCGVWDHLYLSVIVVCCQRRGMYNKNLLNTPELGFDISCEQPEIEF
jgi:hypothetical protein